MRSLVRVVVPLSVFLLLFRPSDTYRPVVLMHGVLSKAKYMEHIRDYITAAHPGTPILNVDLFDDRESLTEMEKQLDAVRAFVRPFMLNATDGVNMVCFSQGALLCRALIETTPDHNVHTFISLAGPHGGQFGDTDYLKDFLPNFGKDHLYEVFYTELGQALISVANYWKDPHHLDLYFKFCRFLSDLNQPSDAHKANFLKLKQAVFIGGPDDGVIMPWQSSHFGFYDSNETVVEYTEQEVYVDDTFGLKTLDIAGKLKIYIIPGVEHVEWIKNPTVFKNNIQQWLS